MDMHRIGRGLLAVAFGTSLMLGGQLATVAPVASAAAGSSRLYPGQTLAPGQALLSDDRSYRLLMQTDGNLVVFDPNNQWLWASWTQGHPGAHAIMQTDGNLVILSTSGVPLWASWTQRHPGAYLSLQPDANLVIYAGATALWYSGSQGHMAYFDGTWQNSFNKWDVRLAGCYAYDTKSTWGVQCPPGYNQGVAISQSPPVWTVNQTWYGTQNWSTNSPNYVIGVNWDVYTFGAFGNSCLGRLYIRGATVNSQAECDSNGTWEAIATGVELVRVFF